MKTEKELKKEGAGHLIINAMVMSLCADGMTTQLLWLPAIRINITLWNVQRAKDGPGDVNQPYMRDLYNKGIGGVDLTLFTTSSRISINNTIRWGKFYHT